MSGPQLGGERGRRPPKQPPQTASMPTQTFVTFAAVSRWWLFFLKQQRSRRKVDQIGAITFSFFGISTENLVKSRPTQQFWPLQKQILHPLEQRSSCGRVVNGSHRLAVYAPHRTDRVAPHRLVRTRKYKPEPEN